MKVPDVWKEIFWLVLICTLFGFLHHGGSFIAPLQYFFFYKYVYTYFIKLCYNHAIYNLR